MTEAPRRLNRPDRPAHVSAGHALLLGSALLMSASCASPAGTAAPASGEVVARATPDTGYVRRIQGLEVIDENGDPVEQPFLGGFNIPRPQLVDIDADGDDDLFLQEWSGSVMFFEHVAGATPRYQWRADRYQDLEVGEWYRFVDLDRDGDADLLAERPFSYLRYYRNDGTPQAALFVTATVRWIS